MARTSSQDYIDRVPEPDLPGVNISQDYIDRVCNSFSKLLEMKRRRYEEMGLSMHDVLFLANDVNVADFFDATIANGAEVKLAANWIMGDVAPYMKNEKLSIGDIKLSPDQLAELIVPYKSELLVGKSGKR